MIASSPGGRRLVLDMDGYQWTVLLAAWLGWGFDAFDSLLFNFVAPNCVPTLLHLPIGSPAAKAATLQWTGFLTSLRRGAASLGMYLPELFPTRLRGTGSGFCYNIGRVLAAAGPFVVGTFATRGAGSAISALFWVGFVPLAGLALLPWVIETKGRTLAD